MERTAHPGNYYRFGPGIIRTKPHILGDQAAKQVPDTRWKAKRRIRGRQRVVGTHAGDFGAHPSARPRAR